MRRLIAFLTRTPTLAAMLIAMTAIAVAFGFVRPLVGGPLLDLLSDPLLNRARLDAMSASQRTAHMWVTLTLDLAYPLAYGGFFAGFAARFAGTRGLPAAIPAFALVSVDMIENTLILVMLSGNESVLYAKAYLTLFKWWLFALVLAVAAVSGLSALYRRFARTRSAAPATGRS